MIAATQSPPAAGAFKNWSVADWLSLLARLVVGGLFIYMGLSKALHPVEFLKLVRQYDAIHAPLALNLVAVALPWLEVLCGLLLVPGIAVRGTALMLAAMLVVFTTLIFLRALAIQKAGGVAFCSIKFDCGCGAGEVFICGKLVENVLLLAASVWLLLRPVHRLCARARLFSRAEPRLAPATARG